MHLLHGFLSLMLTFAASAQPVVGVLSIDCEALPRCQEVIGSNGLEILAHLGGTQYVVRGESSQSELGQIQALSTEQKISRQLSSLSVSRKGLRFLVSVELFYLVPDFFDEIEKWGVRPVRKTKKSFVAVVSQRQLWRLAKMPQVEFIQPLQKVQQHHFAIPPNSKKNYHHKYNGFETGMTLSGFSSAWAEGLSGQGQIIAVADSGLDTGNEASLHQEFAGRVLFGKGYGLYTSDWYDKMGHGTHVAGLISMRGKASSGRLIGGAYQSQLVAQSLWSDIVENLYVPNDIGELFGDAYDRGARIHSNSWGTTDANYENLSAQVDRFVWKNPDFLVLFAAGNGGADRDRNGVVDPGSVSAPATAKNILAVGASENFLPRGGLQERASSVSRDRWPVNPLNRDRFSDNPRGVALFSSRGPTKDGRIKPDILAPGTNIASVKSQMSGVDSLWGTLSSDFVFSGGTSVATPIVASAAALVREKLVSLGVRRPSAALIKGILMNSAHDLFPGQFGRGVFQEILAPRPGPEQGFGRVHVGDAVRLSKSRSFFDNKSGIGQGKKKTYRVWLKKPQVLSATLVYTDYPASPLAEEALVSDLDLSIEIEGRAPIHLKNRKDNWEHFLGRLPAGEVKFVVRGKRVLLPKKQRQPFALIINKSANPEKNSIR